MDYFEGVVREFLKSDRSMFVHDGLTIDLDPSDQRTGKAVKGRYWYCDLAAANFRERTMYLGEVTFSTTLQALVKRLAAWARYWPEVQAALHRDSHVDPNWHVQPWAFIPAASHDLLVRRVQAIDNVGTGSGQMPPPRITCLEDVVPWKHKHWKGKPSEFDRAAQQVVPPDRSPSARGG